jgi:aldehyde dehydrogenase (NAD+)
MMLMALKVAPALLCGNTCVVKPAEPASIILTRLTELLGEVLPPGVLSSVTGLGSVTGSALSAHKNVKKITFTGSVDTGRLVYKVAAEKIIPVTLELGGKSPMIVCEDANIDKCVEGAYGGMRFTRAGQSCTAATRIFVHESKYDEFRDKLVAKVNNLKMGNPNSEETDMGPVITEVQWKKILKFIDHGLKDGKGNVCSKLPTDPALKDGRLSQTFFYVSHILLFKIHSLFVFILQLLGFWVRPVIFEQLSNDHHLCRSEIFGPVTCLVKFKNLDDAFEQANDSNFGLAATLWTNNLQTALRGVNALEAGCVQVNQNVVINPNFPCGGWKQSGLGREASLEDMLETFTHKKTVSMNLL